MNEKFSPRRIALLGVWGAQALALSFLESLLPPLPGLPPGAKLGLSNLVVMFAAAEAGLPDALLLALLKGGFVFLTRGVTAGSMSLAGGVCSAFFMWLFLHKGKGNLLGTSIVCALSHNLAQLLVASLWIGRRAALGYLPFLCIYAAVFGTVTGFLLKWIYPVLQKQKKYMIEKRS